VSELLDGNAVVDDTHYRRLIELFTVEIRKRINPRVLLPHLIQYGTIDMEDAEKIRTQEVNRGSSTACWELLFCLPRHSKDYFKEFMNCLIACEYDDVAKILEPDMYESK